MNRILLSTQEEIILIAVGVLQPDAYAYSIKKEIRKEANVSFSLATIHTILYRMEKQKLLQSAMGGSTEKRGGRSKRLYKLSSRGFATIKELQSARSSLLMKLYPGN